MESGDAEVFLYTEKISQGRIGTDLVLYHPTHDSFITLNKEGESIWNSMNEGMNRIEDLVKQYSDNMKISLETAGYKLITFLEELRAEGFLYYSLQEEIGPLIDVSSASFENDITSKVDTLAILNEISPDYSIREILNICKQKNKSPEQFSILKGPDSNQSLKKVLNISTEISKCIILESKDLNIRKSDVISQLIDSKQKPSANGLRFIKLDEPSEDFSIRDAIKIGQKSSQLTRRRRKRIDIVIIVVGPIVIIVIIISDGGSGPTWGKSRQACKTACV